MKVYTLVKSIYQPTNAINKIQQNTNHKIQFMSNIELLHVVALRCHPNALYLNKAIQEQHTSLGIDRHH
jgi:hypothetical protein